MSDIKYGERVFRPGALWLDDKGVPINAHGGGFLHHEGKTYWFGEHKIEGEAGNKAYVGIRAYSSDDLYSWRDEGIVLKVGSSPDLEAGCIIERPKVIFCKETGKFVMWFHYDTTTYGGAMTGVAVADSPTGNYGYLGAIRPNAGQWPVNVTSEQKDYASMIRGLTIKVSPGENAITPTVNILGRDFCRGQDSRDMTVFVDDDGKAYHVHSSEMNSTTHISELSKDCISLTGVYVRLFPNRWMEAQVIFKRRDAYYLIASGCTGWEPNAARSAVAKSLFGPWRELGNPAVGKGADLTFGAQSTFVLPVPGKKDAFIFMADIWRPKNAIDGRYVWLPIQFEDDRLVIQWFDEWDLSFFDK